MDPHRPIWSGTHTSPGIKLLFFAAGFLVSLVAGELILRFFPAFEPRPRIYVGDEPHQPSENFVPDPEIGWRMRPHHEFTVENAEYHVRYRSNAQGFRDERKADTPEKSRKIVLVGDSFSFGQGVPFDQTFGALIESRLPETAVHNLALQGFGIDQMWSVVKSVGLPMQPDLVIVAFISEDFTRSLYQPFVKLAKGAVENQTPADRPNALIRFIDRHSRLWTGLQQADRLLGHQLPIGAWWTLNRALLEDIRAMCREAGARTLFVYLPTRELRTFPAIRSYMQETASDFIDLGNQPPSPPRPFIYPYDGHPNPDGHRYIAEAVLAWIGREMPELEMRTAR
jgi:lysophospholipase L1-like esterase